VLRCAALCCAVLRCAALCCAVLPPETENPFNQQNQPQPHQPPTLPTIHPPPHQPFGISCRDNVIKECGEEASVPPELAAQAVATGAFRRLRCSLELQQLGLGRSVCGFIKPQIAGLPHPNLTP